MQNKYFISFEELSLYASISFAVPELALISLMGHSYFLSIKTQGKAEPRHVKLSTTLVEKARKTVPAFTISYIFFKLITLTNINSTPNPCPFFFF